MPHTSFRPPETTTAGMPRVFLQSGRSPQRPDWLAGVGGLELRNVVAKYPFERSHRFPVIQPNSPPQRLFAFELPNHAQHRSRGGLHPF
jgi:hypothetical protein